MVSSLWWNQKNSYWKCELDKIYFGRIGNVCFMNNSKNYRISNRNNTIPNFWNHATNVASFISSSSIYLVIILGRLKEVLECPDIIKVFHDCRNDSGVLHAQHGILLQNIFDTQVIIMQVIAKCNDSIHCHARNNGLTMMYLQTIKMLEFYGRCKMKKRKRYSNPFLQL